MGLSYLDYSIGKVNYKFNKIHTDFIRTVRSFSTNQNTVLSASYDKTVKVWDVRDSKACKFQFLHEAEVEDARIFNSDINLVTVGGRFVGSLLTSDQGLGHEDERHSAAESEQQCEDCEQRARV